METAVTVINTVQIGMDEYADTRTTKVFNDNNTISEIKEFIRLELNLKRPISEIGISSIFISDVIS